LSGFASGGDILVTMSDSDLELLARYTRQHAEDAFAEIVRRHLDLVFSAALRQVRSPQLAEEVAQSAFTDLARQAHRLAPDTVVTAWLYQVTRRTAIDVVRREARRQQREQAACELNAMNTSAADWTNIEPLLDEAMQALEEADRTAVLLRYFQNKSLREVGQTLGTNEDAARKRVSRAVERLRQFLAQRGVTVGASGLVIALSANAVQAAPVGLAATISTAAAAILAGTTLATTATTTATKIIAMTTLQKTLFGVTLAAAVGTGIYQARQNSRLGEEVQSLHQTLTPLREEVAQLQTENERLSNLVAQARQPARLPIDQFNELLKLRGKAQLNSREIAELKAALAQGTRIPDFVTRSVNEFLDSAADQERRAQTNGALGRINRMSAKLGLGPEQQQPVHDIILANADPRAGLAMARVTGSMSSLEEIKTRLAKIQADEDGALAGVLTPEQMTAYQQMRADEENAGAQAWVAYEKSIMQRELKLSDEQAEQMSSIFANLKPGSGGPGITEYSNAREQLEIRLRAFASALTPEQLQDYRRLKMEDIEQHEQIPRIIKALK